jgi:pimeloyl-ACP methyl ester carboxylesterase
MLLYVRELGGDGPPLVILHGLYGSSRNWATAGKLLAARFRVVALDLRNHGESPHAPEMTYPLLAADVVETLEHLGLDRVVLLGHSLGGKTAMRLACAAPARVQHLLVADIAPKPYIVDPTPVQAMLGVSLDGVTRRAEVEEKVMRSVDDAALVRFLTTNLERTDGGFAWRIDLAAIQRSLPALGASPVGEGDLFDGPVDFFAGGRSPYFAPTDLAAARRYFPRARAHVFAGSGHDVHVDARDEFVAALLAATAEP